MDSWDNLLSKIHLEALSSQLQFPVLPHGDSITPVSLNCQVFKLEQGGCFWKVSNSLTSPRSCPANHLHTRAQLCLPPQRSLGHLYISVVLVATATVVVLLTPSHSPPHPYTHPFRGLRAQTRKLWQVTWNWAEDCGILRSISQKCSRNDPSKLATMGHEG